MYITPVVNSLYFNRPIGVSKQKADRSFVEQKSAVATTPSFKATVGDAYAAQIAKIVVEKQMNSLARVYLAVLSDIAGELAQYGVSYSKAYCSKKPIKDASTYVSKMLRSGETEVKDWIRGTLYVENPYDLSILEQYILPALEESGYKPSPVKLTPEKAIERGFVPSAEDFRAGEMEVKDISIRLKDAKEHIARTAPNLMNYADGPSPSGYEDIQVHLLNINIKDPIYHELLIIFGKNYAKAKTIESERVYGILRDLKYLSILTGGEMDVKSEMLFKEYLDKISKKFRVEASEKLFRNGKNLDYFKINEQEKISFSLVDEVEMDENFIALEEILEKFYEEKIKKAKNDPELRSKYYKERKTDRKALEKARVSLKESMDFFNNCYGKVKPPKEKKPKVKKEIKPE